MSMTKQEAIVWEKAFSTEYETRHKMVFDLKSLTPQAKYNIVKKASELADKAVDDYRDIEKWRKFYASEKLKTEKGAIVEQRTDTL